MATIADAQPKVKGHALGVSVTMAPKGDEEASQTYGALAPLQADATSGELEIAVTDTQLLVGFAHAAASTVTGTDVFYTPALPGLVIEIAMKTGADADYVLLITDLHKHYPLVVTSGRGYLDNATPGVATTEFCYVYDVAEGSAVGDTNARVLAQITTSAWTRGITA